MYYILYTTPNMSMSMSRSYKGVRGVTRGYKGLQGISSS